MDRRPLGGFPTGLPDGCCVDRLITAMIPLAWKEPEAGFPRQPLPVAAQFVEQKARIKLSDGELSIESQP